MVEKVNLPSERITDFRDRQRALTESLRESVQHINDLRLDLDDAVITASTELMHFLIRRPGKPSSCYWKTLNEYWQSFELFAEKLKFTHQQLQRPFTPHSNLFRVPPEDSAARQWEDVLDELEDELDTLKRGIQERALLQSIIELIDSTERLNELDWPRAKGAGLEYYQALRTLRRKVRHIGQWLENSLRKYGVVPISLSVAQYPPPELTRIIARVDDNVDDNIVISKIVAKGYLWQDRLLRKADVVVITKKEA